MRRNTVASFAVALVVLVTSAPASAAVGGSIGGTVRDASGDPIEGICVEAFGTRYRTGYDRTRRDGHYRIDGLVADDYRVHFSDCGDGSFAGQYYDGVEEWRDATMVHVDSDAVISGIDATMNRRPVITGSVTLADGRPVAGTCVTAFGARTVDLLGQAETAADGFYHLRLAAPGAVKVRFGICGYDYYGSYGESNYSVRYPSAPVSSEGASEGHSSEWFEDAIDFERAKILTLAWEQTVSGVNALLEGTGAITGRVTDLEGAALEGMCVYAYGDRGGFATAWTANNGNYRFGSLRADTYRVRFADCASEEWYESEWFENTEFRALATPLVVGAGTLVEGVNAQMTPLPRPDVAIDSLAVEDVPVTAAGTTVAGSGPERIVRVVLDNVGHARAEFGTLAVWVTTDDGRSQGLGTRAIDLASGAHRVESFRWNTTGTVGSVTVHAVACVSKDLDTSNNSVRAESSVLAGGTGISTRVTGSGSYSDCRNYYY